MSVNEQAKDMPIEINDSETCLLYQEFLMKPNNRVLDFLNENHKVVHDFVRLQCCEILQDEE